MFCDDIFLSREYTLKEIHAYVAVILNCSRGEISGATLLADYRTFPHPPLPHGKVFTVDHNNSVDKHRQAFTGSSSKSYSSLLKWHGYTIFIHSYNYRYDFL
jgi:hypothetical protein